MQSSSTNSCSSPIKSNRCTNIDTVYCQEHRKLRHLPTPLSPVLPEPEQASSTCALYVSPKQVFVLSTSDCSTTLLFLNCTVFYGFIPPAPSSKAQFTDFNDSDPQSNQLLGFARLARQLSASRMANQYLKSHLDCFSNSSWHASDPEGQPIYTLLLINTNSSMYD